jgi:hypothetical protein
VTAQGVMQVAGGAAVDDRYHRSPVTEPKIGNCDRAADSPRSRLAEGLIFATVSTSGHPPT